MGSVDHRSTNTTENSEEKETQRSEGFCLERRVSPRLQNIPIEKRPYYGGEQRRQLHASKGDGCSRNAGFGGQKWQFGSSVDNDETNKVRIDISSRKNLVNHEAKIRSELVCRRFSPRLNVISADKKPYYGSVQRRHLYASKDYAYDKKTEDNDRKRQLDLPKGNADKRKTKAGITVTKNTLQRVSKIRSNGVDQSASLRLKNIPANKRPFNSGDQSKQLDATKDDPCGSKNKDAHQMRLQHSSDENSSEQKTEVNHSTQNCALNMAGKDAEDEDVLSVLGLGPIEYDDTEIVDLEHGAYLEWTRCESFLADSMHQMSGANMRDTVVGLMAVSRLVLTYKDNNIYQQNQESENEVVDVTREKEIVQQFQRIKCRELLLRQRVSPRLQNIPKDKRPYYGSNPTRQLHSAEDYIRKNIDQKRQLYSPKDNTPKKKTKVDHLVQDCLADMARKDVGDRDTESHLAPGSSPVVKYGNTETLDIENCSNLKLMGHQRFLAGHVCRNSSAAAKETVKALSKHYPYFVQDRAAKLPSKLPGLVCEDVSYGKEDITIPVTNLIDPPNVPAGYKYIKSSLAARNVVIPPSPSGCDCKGNCTNPKSCSCAQLNGSDFPYVRKDGGRLIEPKDVVFECGPGCGCGPNCINRISQRGLKYQLEVYRTLNKGWAVRSWDFIPSGAPVCEYAGVLRRCADLDNDSENEFIFEIDCWHTMKGIGGRERRQGCLSVHARNLVEKVDEVESETEFCIDGGFFGNVTRFINHSCDPNLFVQCILSSHHDIRLARIVLFAADDIPPMQELTYDYGYALDSVIGPDGKLKKLPCYCGTSECRGRLY